MTNEFEGQVPKELQGGRRSVDEDGLWGDNVEEIGKVGDDTVRPIAPLGKISGMRGGGKGGEVGWWGRISRTRAPQGH